MEFAKEDFLESLEEAGFDQQDLAEMDSILINPIIYVLAINNGFLQQYTSHLSEGEFHRFADSIELVEIGGPNTIEFIEDDGVLYINSEEIDGLSKMSPSEVSALLTNIVDPPNFWGGCCDWCWAVHQMLDIHVLDCICCLGTCEFQCDPEEPELGWGLL